MKMSKLTKYLIWKCKNEKKIILQFQANVTTYEIRGITPEDFLKVHEKYWADRIRNRQLSKK